MKVFSEPPIKKKLDLNNIKLDKLVEEAVPPLEGVDNPIFEEFCSFYFGVCDGFKLRKDWKKRDDLSKWRYVALCNTYWCYFYQQLNEQYEYKEYKKALKEWSKKNPAFLKTLKCLEEKEEI